jgi:hypothetical protein
VPFAYRRRDEGPPWKPGDVVDGHVLTGSHQWVPVPTVATPKWPKTPTESPLKAWWGRMPVELRVAFIVVPILVAIVIIGNL